jgi:hypothetical protein
MINENMCKRPPLQYHMYFGSQFTKSLHTWVLTLTLTIKYRNTDMLVFGGVGREVENKAKLRSIPIEIASWS